MIAVRLEGRLGNQLFQYAFIYAAAKKLNTTYYIDQYIVPSLIDKYFKTAPNQSNRIISELFKINGFKNFFNYHLRRQYYGLHAFIRGYKLNIYGFTDNQHEVDIQDNTIYQGYFQSVLLIQLNKKLIRDRFILKDEFVFRFNKQYNDLYNNNKNIIAVHIRRTDYLNQEHLNLGKADLSLPISYYNQAIDLVTRRYANPYFIFVTDDKPFVKSNFSHLLNKTISEDIEIIDFQHLLNAQACIISNSTFSWWGAWLNAQKNKVVYCPQYYLGFHLKKEFPANIYPVEWEKIDF